METNNVHPDRNSPQVIAASETMSACERNAAGTGDGGRLAKCPDCQTVGEHYCPADVAREFEYTCEYCEEACDELITVDDSDRSVGYRDTLEVCRACFTEKQLHRHVTSVDCPGGSPSSSLRSLPPKPNCNIPNCADPCCSRSFSHGEDEC